MKQIFAVTLVPCSAGLEMPIQIRVLDGEDEGFFTVIGEHGNSEAVIAWHNRRDVALYDAMLHVQMIAKIRTVKGRTDHVTGLIDAGVMRDYEPEPIADPVSEER